MIYPSDIKRAAERKAQHPHFQPNGRDPLITQAMRAEIERRRARSNERSTTGVLMGDPPPGYSALDKRALAMVSAS
jgi:hypothetical protein